MFLTAVPSQSPLNVSAMNDSSTSIQVSWEPPTTEFTFGILRAFIIRYALASDQEAYNYTTISSDVTTHIIEGLLEFTLYNIEIAASTVGIGPFSDPVSVMTDEDSELEGLWELSQKCWVCSPNAMTSYVM